MGKKILAISLVLAMVITFGACGAKTPSAQEIVNGVIQSQNDVKTYQFDMGMTMAISGESDGESVQGTITMDADGACDLPNTQLRMQMNMTMDITAPEVEEQAIEMEAYVIGNTVYMLANMEGISSGWMKSEAQAETWKEQMTQVESQAGLLQAADVELLGSEKIKGVDCYVLQVTPDLQKLWEIVMQQEALAMEVPQITPGAINDIFQSFSIKYWVEKDTYFLAKTDIQMKMELTPQAMGIQDETGQVNLDMSMTLLAYDYNKAVTITLPPEAQNATEVP